MIERSKSQDSGYLEKGRDLYNLKNSAREITVKITLKGYLLSSKTL
jgi:hypothetical protein